MSPSGKALVSGTSIRGFESLHPSQDINLERLVSGSFFCYKYSMSNEADNYLTKPNPSVEDWISYNKPFFDSAKLYMSDENESLGAGTLAMELDELSAERLSWAILTDFDLHAIQHGSSQIEYFDELAHRVGSLGKFALKLIAADSESTAVVIGLSGVDDYPAILRSTAG